MFKAFSRKRLDRIKHGEPNESGETDIQHWLQHPMLPNLLTLLFAVVGAFLVAHHVLWRDEAQAFLIARDSRSLRDLLAYVHYEGHPPLWYFLLFLATRITQRPEVMQWLHLAMATTTVYLAPFPLLGKVLFPFGYFTLFEYGILSRNYQLIQSIRDFSK